MAASEISVAVTGELATLVCDAVASGEYPTHADVVRVALEQWSENREPIDIAHVKRCWDEAMLSDETVSVDKDEMFTRLRAKYGLGSEYVDSQ